MISLGTLLDPASRQPASCLIEIGDEATDLGDLAALVASVQIAVSRSEAATGSILIEDRRGSDGRWMAADSGLFERWARIKVSADFQTHTEEILRGYIAVQKPSYPNNGGEATIELTLQDDSAALDREHLRTVWGEDGTLTDLEILRELIAPAGLEAHPESGDGQSSRSLSQDATPIAFLRERAKANGYELIFSAGQVYFGPKRLDGEAQAPIMVYAGSATSCLSLEIVDDGQSPDTVQFDHAPREEGNATTSESVVPDLPALGTSPAAAEGAGVGTPSVWRVSREGDETEQELRARAQALVNDNSFKLRATGELDGSLYGHVLQVGRMVKVDGPGARYGGLYYVDKVTHVFSSDGYRQQLELIRNATGETDAPLGPLSQGLSAIAGLF
jgi:phage protein D